MPVAAKWARIADLRRMKKAEFSDELKDRVATFLVQLLVAVSVGFHGDLWKKGGKLIHTKKNKFTLKQP